MTLDDMRQAANAIADTIAYLEYHLANTPASWKPSRTEAVKLAVSTLTTEHMILRRQIDRY